MLEPPAVMLADVSLPQSLAVTARFTSLKPVKFYSQSSHSLMTMEALVQSESR
jgi:hypothetical protein